LCLQVDTSDDTGVNNVSDVSYASHDVINNGASISAVKQVNDRMSDHFMNKDIQSF